jgi:hypothetical protein
VWAVVWALHVVAEHLHADCIAALVGALPQGGGLQCFQTLLFPSNLYLVYCSIVWICCLVALCWSPPDELVSDEG